MAGRWSVRCSGRPLHEKFILRIVMANCVRARLCAMCYKLGAGCMSWGDERDSAPSSESRTTFKLRSVHFPSVTRGEQSIQVAIAFGFGGCGYLLVDLVIVSRDSFHCTENAYGLRHDWIGHPRHHHMD